MKKFLSWLLILAYAGAFAAPATRFDNVVVRQTMLVGSSTTASINSASALEIKSTTKGLLLPRMSQLQRDSIATPVEGLQVHNTTTNKPSYYNGTRWADVGTGSGSGGAFPNFVQNGDAESGTQSWTASAGTFATTSTAANLYAGTASFSWTPAAGGNTLTNDAIVITSGGGLSGANAAAQCTIKTAGSSHKIQVYDGSNVLSERTLTAGTTFTTEPVNFVGPASGSVYLRIYAGSTDVIYFDNCFLGDAANLNLANVSQSALVGTVKVTGCSSVWSKSSGTFADLNAETGCSYAVTGDLVAPSTNIPAFKIKNGIPGKYVFEYTGRWGAASSGSFSDARFTDGTNNALEENSALGNNDDAIRIPNAVGTIEYPSGIGASTEIKLQVRNGASGTTYVYGTTDTPAVFKVYRFPLTSQLVGKASTNDAQGSVIWSDVANCVFASTSGSATILSDSDCGNPTRKTGSAANPTTANNLEVTFANLPAGDYEITPYGSYIVDKSSTDTTCTFQTYDGSTVIGTSTAKSTSGSVAVSNFGGVINYSATQATKVFSIRAIRDGGDGTCACDARSGKTCGITVKRISGSTPHVRVLKDVETTLGAGLRIEALDFTCMSSSSINWQTGGFASVGNRSGGTCTVSITSGIFTAAPVCTFTNNSSAQRSHSIVVSSATALTVYNSTAEDWRPLMICVGAK